MRMLGMVVLVLLVLSAGAVSAAQEGVVEGTLIPPDASARISAVPDGGTVAALHTEAQGGTFRLSLAAGTYTIIVSAPVSSFPVRLEAVVVKAEETTTLPPVQIMPGSGKAVLAGRVIPPRPNSRIKLMQEGKERATVHADRDGRYEFKELPAGTYEVRAAAPGHADDIAPVVVPENQTVKQTAVLLPIVATDGVDWTTGKIRATGVGSPPANAENSAQARAMTQRAAIADAQRNLLRIIEQIKIDDGRSVGTIMRNGNMAQRIHGFVKGYTMVSQRELDGGRIEVVLELPLTGPSGLSRFVTEQ